MFRRHFRVAEQQNSAPETSRSAAPFTNTPEIPSLKQNQITVQEFSLVKQGNRQRLRQMLSGKIKNQKDQLLKAKAIYSSNNKITIYDKSTPREIKKLWLDQHEQYLPEETPQVNSFRLVQQYCVQPKEYEHTLKKCMVKHNYEYITQQQEKEKEKGDSTFSFDQHQEQEVFSFQIKNTLRERDTTCKSIHESHSP